MIHGIVCCLWFDIMVGLPFWFAELLSLTQVLLHERTFRQLSALHPDGMDKMIFRNMGRHALKGIHKPVFIVQVMPQGCVEAVPERILMSLSCPPSVVNTAGPGDEGFPSHPYNFEQPDGERQRAVAA